MVEYLPQVEGTGMQVEGTGMQVDVMEQELATRIQNYLCLDAHYRPFDCSCKIGPIMPIYILYGYLL